MIKTFNYKKNQEYYSIDYAGLLKTDTIQIKIKGEFYYISNFKNEYIIYDRHKECELITCKINNFNVSCIRGKFRILKEY